MTKESLEQFDVVVVGAGIIGLASASELVKHRGRVLLCDSGECHRGTSANSHRIIHGGIRYLQQLNLRRILRSIKAQDYCLKEYSDLVKPLECYLLLSGKGLQRKLPMSIAGIVYTVLRHLLTGVMQPATVTRDASIGKLHSTFSKFNNRATFSWTDARLVDPSELANRLKDKFIKLGGEVREYSPVRSIDKEGDLFRISFESDQKTIQAQKIVLALGSRFGTLEVDGVNRVLPKFSFTKAFNLVFDEDLTQEKGVGFQSISGQVLFATPRGDGRSAIGTWYLLAEGPETEISEYEIESALLSLRDTLGDHELFKRERVVSVEQGSLLSKGAKNGEPNPQTQEKVFSHDGIIEVLSCKYTTFPVIAEEVVQAVERMT